MKRFFELSSSACYKNDYPRNISTLTVEDKWRSFCVWDEEWKENNGRIFASFVAARLIQRMRYCKAQWVIKELEILAFDDLSLDYHHLGLNLTMPHGA